MACYEKGSRNRICGPALQVGASVMASYDKVGSLEDKAQLMYYD